MFSYWAQPPEVTCFIQVLNVFLLCKIWGGAIEYREDKNNSVVYNSGIQLFLFFFLFLFLCVFAYSQK
jgi:hypothetical protein